MVFSIHAALKVSRILPPAKVEKKKGEEKKKFAAPPGNELAAANLGACQCCTPL